MTTTNTYISPIDAAHQVEFDLPDCRSGRVKRYGIGYGQGCFWGNVHFADMESLSVALDAMLADIRTAYGTAGRRQTGRFIEENTTEFPAGCGLIRKIRFIPLLKSGKRGKTIHTIQVYSIEVTEARIAAISNALRIPVR
jgi:hypothetical protein